MADFRSELVAAAVAEKSRVNGRKETNDSISHILSEYWVDGAGLSASASKTNIKKRVAWSAAFISTIVRRALVSSGSTAHFAFSGSHSIYAGAAIRNSLTSASKPAFYGYPPTGLGAAAPEVGDLVGVTRVKLIDSYAAALGAATAPKKDDQTYYSHFDVVTNIQGNKIELIGGNVSDTVSMKTMKLDSGLLPILPFKYDKSGRVISGPFICIIKYRS